MNWKDRFREYFSFTSTEKRGILVWAFLMILLIFLPFARRLWSPAWVPDTGTLEAALQDFEDSRQAFPSSGNEHGKPLERYDTIQLFPFDPNRNSYEDWLALGLTARQALTADHYLQSGGRFNSPESLKKIYGLEPGQYELLAPYIRIRRDPARAEAEPGEEAFQPEVQAPALQILEINSSDSIDLLALPGIGPVLASRMVRYRELLGGYYSTGQLKEVYGLTDSLVSSWGDRVRFDTSRLRKIDLNQAGYRDLFTHPYLDFYQARALVRYRETMGSFSSPEEILKNRLLPDSVFRKLEPYLQAGGVRAEKK